MYLIIEKTKSFTEHKIPFFFFLFFSFFFLILLFRSLTSMDDLYFLRECIPFENEFPLARTTTKTRSYIHTLAVTQLKLLVKVIADDVVTFTI
jgi:hypothetical protein